MASKSWITRLPPGPGDNEELPIPDPDNGMILEQDGLAARAHQVAMAMGAGLAPKERHAYERLVLQWMCDEDR